MCTFWKWVVVLLVPTIWATTTRAQESIVPEGATVKLLLLRQKSVQKELELTPAQIKEIHTFTDAQSEAAHKASELGEAERRKAFGALVKKNEQFLTSTLKEPQSKRLDQIAMQFAALHHLLKPEAVRELKLTEAQQQKLRDLQKESHQELADIIRAKDREGRHAKLVKHRETTRTAILGILTDEQKTKVREVAGPPFTGEIVIEDHEPSKDK